MSRGPRLRVAHARLAAALGALGVACSSGLGEYRLVHERGDGSAGVTVTGSGGNDTVGGAPSEDGGSGNHGGQSDGGGGGTGNGDSGGTAGASGARMVGGSGGAGAGGSGAGGVGTGGVGAGGMGMGGGSAGKGGTAGVGAGGVVGNGGMGSGGMGMGNGGMGTGGMGVGGTGGTDPVAVPLNKALTGITAAAWSAPNFYLLEAAASRFWSVAPEGGTVAGPYPLPADTYGAAFGASTTWVYAASKTKVYRVPAATGSSTAAGVALTTKVVQPSGAYAGGYFLIGDTANVGTTAAQVMSEATGALDASAKSLGTIYQVAGDPTNFAFTTLSVSGVTVVGVHRVAAGTFVANPTPCRGGANGSQADAISVAGTSVAWVLDATSKKQLNIAAIPASGVCPTSVDSALFGASSGPSAVGLIDAKSALVVDSYGNGAGNIVILRIGGAPSALVPISTGNSLGPKSIIVGASHYAAVATGNIPTILAF